MGDLTGLLLLVAAYPFIAAWLVGLRRTFRVDELEKKVASLSDRVQQLSPVTPAPRSVIEQVQPSHTPPPVAGAPPAIAVVPTVALHGAGATAAPPGTTEENNNETVLYRQAAPSDHATAFEEALQARLKKRSHAKDTPAPFANPAAPPGNTAIADPGTPPPRWLVAAKTWLMTGNLVAKLGLVILFIGVGFLLKYVAVTITIPMELRLAAVVLADFCLLGWGWRLRMKRREIALPVQGTAIAILMLVIFSASQRYGIMPAGFALTLLVALMVFTCLLAVLQEAPWLAAFGITGGFACPVLLSTGQGSHIALFSYYALLNAGIFVLALKRSWHQLNLLGFAFTFGVGGAWGGLQYVPEHYLSAQAFLILFFLCYTTIPLTFAGRQATRWQAWVDVILIMGTPLLTFGFQVGLVKDMPFGLAFSALALGLFYIVTGTILWRSGKQRWKMLVQTFFVLGAIFGTLTIPFALDARWTSAAWALEGVGFVWYGLRHKRRAIWCCGLLLQAASWISFIPALSSLDDSGALAANLWLSFLILSVSAFAVAVALRNPEGDEDDLAPLANMALGVAAAWLLAGWWTEAGLRFWGGVLANWIVAGAMLTAVLLYGISRRLAWPAARKLVLAVQIAGAIGLVVTSAPGGYWINTLVVHDDEPLLGLIMLAVAAFVTSRAIGRAAPGSNASPLASAMLLWSGIWWFGPVISISMGRVVPYMPDVLGSPYALWILLKALAIAATSVACLHFSLRLAWPQLRWSASACWGMLAIITIEALAQLYRGHYMLEAASWIAWALALAGSEYAMLRWQTGGSPLNRTLLAWLHAVRTGGPWLAIWPTGAILIDGWLETPTSPVYGQDSWIADAAWNTYFPTWAMMLVLVILLRRSLAGAWPTAPLAH